VNRFCLELVFWLEAVRSEASIANNSFDRAPIWSQLKLRHVKLEQIHRQKEGRFQTLLNKIRNGVTLEPHEWYNLEEKKHLPPHIFSIRLMSRKKQVDMFNDNELCKIKNITMSWRAVDTVIKLSPRSESKLPSEQNTMGEATGQQYKVVDEIRIKEKIGEYKRLIVNYHRFPSELYLKVGAKVVLLHNLDPPNGLVNGSQGEIVGLKGFDDSPDKQTHSRSQIAAFEGFRRANHYGRPVVCFANGCETSIMPIVQNSLQGPSSDRYLLSRTQIPLALAWALSIHKSQGMTLGYAEVSSKDNLSRVSSMSVCPELQH
jgi:ATP-dependent DNA helicase PIF1